jgi:CBS domain-containing protein
MRIETIGELARRSALPSLQSHVSVFAAVDVLDLYEADIIGVECNDAFSGVFSRSDLKRLVLQRGLNPQHTLLHEVLPLNTPSVPWHFSLKDTYCTMLAYQWAYMPVLCGNKLCGIVTLQELEENLRVPYDSSPVSGVPESGVIIDSAYA